MSGPTPTGRPIRVLIADDHPIVREGLRSLVSLDPAMEVVGEATDGREMIELGTRLRPDVALVDLRMPSVDGVEALAALRERAPEVRGIVLTTFSGDEDVVRAFRAGARAYLLKDASREELLACIRAVHEGRSWMSSVAVEGLAARLDADELTPRERDVLRLMVAGRGNKEIATTLHVAEGTVKAHVNRILSKLRVTTRTEAVTEALRRGLVHLDDGQPTIRPRDKRKS
jgi:two-component system NarL family response regulator